MADNTLRIALLMDLKGLNQNLNKAQSRLKAFSGRLKNIGGQLQTRLALPLVAAGGASIKMAADFDKSMTKIKTLVGVASEDVDAMTGSVKAMASQAGVSSSEAAEALFFITSAGLRGSDAMEVLEQSTKAAALGLGETATVADLATSALNAYGAENMSATDATDVLTAAVREGKLEASELSSVMGQVLPVASNMGVQFHEVGAAFAAMSRTGTPAAQAATQLNSILTGIMKPTKDAEKAMLALGTSKEKLRKQIKDDGLLSVLETLKAASETNSAAFERVFGNVRALRGILDLTGKSAATTAEIFNRMANTTGITSQAFDELQNSAEFKLRKGLRELQNQFSDLGAILMDSLMPVFVKIMDTVKGLFIRFKNLSPQTQQMAVAFGALAVVLPTVLSILGALGTVVVALTGPIGIVAAALAGVVYFFDEIVNAAVSVRNALFEHIGKALLKIELYFKKFINVLKFAGKYVSEFSENLFDADFASISEELEKEQKKLGENIQERLDKHMAEAVKRKGMPKYKNIIQKAILGAAGGVGIKAPAGVSAEQPMPQKNLGDIFGGGMQFKKSIDSLATSNSWSKLNEKIKTTSENVKNLTEERFKVLQEKANLVGLAVGDAFSNMSNRLVESLGLASTGFQGFISGLISTITQLIAMMLSASISQAIAGATASGTATGPAAVITTPAFIATAVGGVLSAFAAIPKFANGGIVSAPTLGLMGEYTGARQNPEVIAPLDKLKGMIGQQPANVNVGGQFRIQGQDLVLALQRADRNRSRIK